MATHLSTSGTLAEPVRDAHPYIPNSAASVRQRMLAAAGLSDIEDVFAEIPSALRLTQPLDLPPPLTAEADLSRHMAALLGRNRPAEPGRSFLGAGCYQHYVPAVCTEVNSRAEFLTAYAGEAYEDHGKWQALFEYTSLMAELLELDVVNVPTYDGYQAAATALRMAGRITGRPVVAVSNAVSAAKMAMIGGYLDQALTVRRIPHDRSGQVDMDALAEILGSDVAAVYIESPNAFGVVEGRGPAIAEAAHAAGALLVVGTDPIALGYLETPARWGADLVCGDIQSLGLGMHFGGANGGFIASPDDERFVFEYPSRLFGLAPTRESGQIGFCDIAYERTSLASREQGNEWVGTAAALWGITAGVYLSLMGPVGLSELGAGVAARTRYAMQQIGQVESVTVPFAESPHWREFIIRIEKSDITINGLARSLLERGIYGPVDMTQHMNAGQVGLVCVTEQHTQDDIDHFVSEVRSILR